MIAQENDRRQGRRFRFFAVRAGKGAGTDRTGKGTGMILRYATIILTAAMLAAATALGISVAQPQKAEAADTVTVTGCTDTLVVLDTSEKRMLDLHNQTRANAGLRQLCVHPALQKAAEAHSQDMIDRDYFSHTSQDGTTFAQRIKLQGYNYRAVGENVAWGSGSLGTPDSIFKSWMNSSGHKSNILSERYREIGVGAVTGTYKSYSNATMWTADFGAR
jgi:uncharacterized protein YkwD